MRFKRELELALSAVRRASVVTRAVQAELLGAGAHGRAAHPTKTGVLEKGDKSPVTVADFASHPLRFYFDFGLRVTVNTDNRLITDTTVTKELMLAHREMGFTLEDLCTVLVQGFKSTFLPFREKQDLLRAVNAEIADVIARFTGPRPAAAEKASAR